MAMCARALALCCAVLLVGLTAGYTVDCNHEYTDCDSELGKIADEDELPTHKSSISEEATVKSTTSTTEPTTEIVKEHRTDEPTTELTELQEVTNELKPKPRLLNLNVDELQNFANVLHNQTNKGSKKLTDLSDINMDDDEEESGISDHQHEKEIPDKFFSNLQAPFHPLVNAVNREMNDVECKENGVGYKIGEMVDRACEETCECMPGGAFECSPRCKHPYIRQGRRLDDPLCFESPVDECCSIIACATGTGERKPAQLEVCKFGNETYTVGSRWHRGCDQTCVCEAHSVVTCNPRCKPITSSEKCISVQDPSDACCKMQVCDVSEDVHELADNVTSSTVTPTSPATVDGQNEHIENYEEERTSNNPQIVAEPIGSIKVLQNNSVQVNLMHANNSEDPIHLLLSSDNGKTFQDVELKYSNLILNLEGGKDYILKTKETGTKFNFTITSSDGLNEVEDFNNVSKVGCWHEEKFYGVGEEFRIGCTELCECTGNDTHECAALLCPNHVGLEIMSKGCVKWAPSPPAQPPNCCPRSARCLSDGTCHYNGVPVPNWSEVPISLTGCEQRCFCENGDLDCQEVCTPLPPVPPQNLRCPPMHRPAPVNMSDDDCCKQWGCLPNSGKVNGPSKIPTTLSPILPFATTQEMSTKPSTLNSIVPLSTKPFDYMQLNTFKSFPKFLTDPLPPPSSEYASELNKKYLSGYHNNMTLYPLDDFEGSFETAIEANPPLVHNDNSPPADSKVFKNQKSFVNIDTVNETALPYLKKHFVFDKHHIYNNVNVPTPHSSNIQNVLDLPTHKNISITSNLFNRFNPTKGTKVLLESYNHSPYPEIRDKVEDSSESKFFSPDFIDTSRYVLPKPDKSPLKSSPTLLCIKHAGRIGQSQRGKITILKTKDLKPSSSENENIWSAEMDADVLKTQLHPYETVLLRPVLSTGVSSPSIQLNPIQVASKSYSAMDLENFLNQMEVHTEENRNLGRSADKNQGHGVAGHISHNQVPDYPHKPHQPPFLPTIPPEVYYPQDDDENNIHRPQLPGPGVLPGLPPGIQGPTSFGDMNKKLAVISIESDSPTSIKMLLGLPPVLVGLRGSVDLRYTDKVGEDVSQWYSQVFAPADEILTTPRLEFRLTGLTPSTAYKVRGKLFLHNLPVSPESDTYNVRTQDVPTSVVVPEEKRRAIDGGLKVFEVNDTVARVTWRHFSEDELQLIDGIQVRYRPVGTPIYSMTELLHHSRSAADLIELRSSTQYEASLVLVPPPRATVELYDPGQVQFVTLPYSDPYNFSVTIDTQTVGSSQAELSWSGVPAPAERWVRVYRAAHACGDPPAPERDHFTLPLRDHHHTIVLEGLDPDTRCRIWLELFLTNGKVKTSNVLEINTKSLDTDNPIDNEISSAASRGAPRGDYYTALVGVGVVAALGALTSLLLLLVVVRRHRPHSVPITPVPSAPRESSLPPYDNPAYKLELQQETMDL